MKKTVLILFSFFIAVQITFAQQPCRCNDNGWQPFFAQIRTTTQTVACGHQFSITCADTFRLKGNYKCLGNCTAKYKAVLKNTVTNTIVQNYPSFSFTWVYHFATAGSYSLEITPICGTTTCQPCRFFFTVGSCNPVCDCNPEGWKPGTAIIGTQQLNIKCGYQFSLKIGKPIKIDSKYVCKGDCNVKYVAVLINVATGAVIQNFSPFNFPWGYTFTSRGNYRLEITPICGNHKCQPCVYFFTVTP